MKAGEIAVTLGSSAFARRRSLSAGLMVAQTRLLNYQLVGLLAVCLLAASSTKAWAQLCTCAEPGWMNCALAGFHSHEPATAAFPQCQVHARGAAPPRRAAAPKTATRPTTPTRPKLQQMAPVANDFVPQTSHQIQPLPCPRGFTQVGETFYGGTKCAPVGRPTFYVEPAQPPQSILQAEQNQEIARYWRNSPTGLAAPGIGRPGSEGKGRGRRQRD